MNYFKNALFFGLVVLNLPLSSLAGPITSSGGRVRPEVTCRTLEHNRYKINNFKIYNANIGNPNPHKHPLVMTFSLDESSRHPGCFENNDYSRSARVQYIEGTRHEVARYVSIIDPRVRGPVYKLEYQEFLGENQVLANLSSNYFPCKNLLGVDEITLICTVLEK